jgi:hypothetical protein
MRTAARPKGASVGRSKSSDSPGITSDWMPRTGSRYALRLQSGYLDAGSYGPPASERHAPRGRSRVIALWHAGSGEHRSCYSEVLRGDK